MSTSFMRPQPPYYAVIITSQLTDEDQAGYEQMSRAMTELGVRQPGYLGREGMVDGAGRDLTVIYYTDDASIRAWKADIEHLEAQRLGKERWYESYHIEVARVERAYGFTRTPSPEPVLEG
ncbi:antibiotic biosynthesis monooxygenase [Actinospica durhamensis]|uniref:Antibiotic biosynthesis monooxygenase n=1 Tax=Actinospica durhamensis TaxID=1508375 RepID=A0A941EMF4_9ACTN|nr:antibiotic biosynthesis monooxygenase [Actinospica durhamensis]MBR7834377.1 antibiotic biosynthesis monooxygenase [Actinospica durhamensis]